MDFEFKTGYSFLHMAIVFAKLPLNTQKRTSVEIHRIYLNRYSL